MDDFDAIIGQAKRTVGLSQKMANDVYPNGATLICEHCPHKQHATSADCARYFTTGWPKHCRATMGAEKIP